MPDSPVRQGVIYAIAAYLMWGIAPIYFHAITDVPADEILMHRVFWSFWLVLALVKVSGQMGQIRALMAQPSKLGVLGVTSVLIAGNWLIFIWAVTHGHVLDASLGYYINPLLNVALGLLVLGERPSRVQWTAVVIAAIGVLMQLIQFGSVPWVSLALAGSFGAYGLLRKQVNLQATTGLLMETALLMPLALGYWWWLDSPSANLGNNPLSLNLLLIAAGIVTTLPLLAFAAAAVRIPFYLLGMLQYIGPSVMLLLALTLFGETMAPGQIWTFGFIWAALLLLSLDGLNRARRTRRQIRSGTRDSTS